MKNYNDKDYNNSIQAKMLSKIQEASNEINKKTRTSSANYITVGSQVADSLTTIINRYHNRKVKIGKIKYKLGK